jgi:hypothetical protein
MKKISNMYEILNDDCSCTFVSCKYIVQLGNKTVGYKTKQKSWGTKQPISGLSRVSLA